MGENFSVTIQFSISPKLNNLCGKHPATDPWATTGRFWHLLIWGTDIADKTAETQWDLFQAQVRKLVFRTTTGDEFLLSCQRHQLRKTEHSCRSRFALRCKTEKTTNEVTINIRKFLLLVFLEGFTHLLTERYKSMVANLALAVPHSKFVNCWPARKIRPISWTESFHNCSNHVPIDKLRVNNA